MMPRCGVPECRHKPYVLGLCSGHYTQWRRERTLQPLRKVARGTAIEDLVAEVEELLPITAERLADGLSYNFV